MPPVRELQSLIAEQQQAIAPQKALIDQSIEQNAASGAAQEAGLAATQKKAFGNIEQAAQNKGMFFSGFSPDQQAEYTSSTYLPALAQLQATIAATRTNLLGKKADLDTDIYKSAFATRESDVAAKRTFDSEQERRAWEAEQARIQREAAAAEAERNRQHESRLASASRAASQAASAGPSLTKNKNGGWEVSDGLDLAGYARATGKDLITLLQQGDAKDRQAAKWYVDKINKYGTKDAAKYFEELKRDRPTAFYRGG